MSLLKINRYIVLLLLADVFVVSGFGLIDPIFAVFASEHVTGGSLASAGIAISIFMITKSVVQLPFSREIDTKDDAFDLRWLIVGNVLVIAAPVVYLFATSIWHVFVAQLILGIGAGLAYPAWLGIWDTHLDTDKESFEWSLYSTITGIAGAITAALGAFIADAYGFRTIFILVIFFSVVGVSSLMYLYSFHRKAIESQ